MRLHLLELEDQEWLPRTIRDGVTDFLQFAVSVADLYAPLAERLDLAIQRSGANRIVDLCSGAGGPWRELAKQLSAVRCGQTSVLLTDYFPNAEAFVQTATDAEGRIDFVDYSVSALDVPVNISGFRTLFSSFHHFRPEQARKIIADAVSKKQGIAIAESTQNHPLMIAYMLLTPILVLLSSPWQKPFRWSRLFWTYVLPAVPFVVMFDGIVSCLRTYSPNELLDLAGQSEGAEDFHWESGVEKIKYLPIGVTYLIGYPKQSN